MEDKTYDTVNTTERSIDELVENEQPVVSFLVHENDMNHKDLENERLHETHRKTVRDICFTFVVIIVIFVTAYTIRTAIWQNTVLKMNDAILEMANLHHHCGVEVENAESTNTP